jgi:hypothetical protein
MSKRFGILFCAALIGVAAMPAATAQAGFTMTVTIEDLTRGGTTTSTFGTGDSLSGNSNELLIASSSFTPIAGQSLDLTALDAKFTDSSSANIASLKLSGAAAASGTDTFLITVTAVRTDFGNPVLDSDHVAVLTESQSGTFTSTVDNGDTQNYQSYLDLNNAGNTSGTGVFTPGQQVIAIPAVTSTTSGIPNPASATTSIGFDTYTTPYALTTTFSIRLTGNGSTDNPATDQFQASTTVTSKVGSTAVPEPGSVVLLLTGMPLPLVVLGMLRRRRAAAA